MHFPGTSDDQPIYHQWRKYPWFLFIYFVLLHFTITLMFSYFLAYIF